MDVPAARFSALQRAEIAEIVGVQTNERQIESFSALQRAEIAEIDLELKHKHILIRVSVLFNEPKLLKFRVPRDARCDESRFQCSSTSRNC